VYAGTPAWRAGILGGDRITRIDETSTDGISLDDAMKKMRGDVGTKVKLTILREGRDTPLGRSNQFHPSIPLAEPVRGRRFRSDPTGSRRFGGVARAGLLEVGRQ